MASMMSTTGGSLSRLRPFTSATPCLRSLRRCSVRPAAASDPRIREFIASECPVAGFDGRFRERARESSLEADIIAGELLTPGCQKLLRVSSTQLEQVVQDKGQVLLCVMQQDAASPTPLAPPKGGSYACLAQVYGVQRLPEGKGGYLRLVAQQRVLVQALKAGSESGLRAQAAVLDDRWAYYVRAQVVESVMEGAIAASGGSAATQEKLSMAGQPADVRSSIASMQDVAQQLQGALRQVQDLLLTQQKRKLRSGADTDQVDEVLDEVSRIFDFVQGPTGGSDVHSFAALQRLSYAVYSAQGLMSLAGLPSSDLQKQRFKAMEATDLGLRLEQAMSFTEDLIARLSAMLALQS